MIRRSLESIAATWVAGLLVLLPLALTVAVLAWVLSLVNRLVGPGSLVGRLFGALGYPFSRNPELQYVLGTVLLIVGIYLLGLLVPSRLKRAARGLTARTLRRVPIVGSVYGLVDRFVGLLDREQDADIGTMSPVWCFLGDRGVAVLALAASGEPIDIDGRAYLAVLVPTAPVPFSGALLYVPTDWIRPANIGVETLTAVYVSLGITSPHPPGPARVADPARGPA